MDTLFTVPVWDDLEIKQIIFSVLWALPRPSTEHLLFLHGWSTGLEKLLLAFCYSPRGNKESCNAKEGSPFGPFWNRFTVDFTGSEFYGPFHYDVYNTDIASQWKRKYPPTSWPVLAFTGAPASFPVQLENKYLQKCVIWSDEMQRKARKFIKDNLPKGAFIGIHLRNGIDWVRACEFISTTPNLFAAPQCLGYRNERGKATQGMCLPSLDIILKHIKRVIRNGKKYKINLRCIRQ
uniref:GDP-fucose protein O-fucosyltransferase 1 n=1 Tax=Fopius arisanus TaxID=64838 RepID=A0A0C9PIE6_9HYME